MDIKFNGSLDPLVIRKAIKLIGKSPLWAVLLRVALTTLIFFLWGSTLSLFLAGTDISTSRLIRNIVSSLVAGYYVIQPYIASRRLYKALTQGNQQVTGLVTAVGVSYDLGTGRSADYSWSDYYHVFKADDLIVLATADVRISILPRSLFATEQDWKYFIQYVDSRVKPVK